MNKFLFYNYLPILADHILDVKYSHRQVHHNYPPFISDNVKEGDVVFVKTDLLPIFFDKYYFQIKTKFYLINGVGANGVDKKYLKYLNEDKIIKWIGCNILFEHDNIVKIPIGFEENELPGGDQKLLDKMFNSKQVLEDKVNKVLITKLGTTHKSRQNVIPLFKNTSYCQILTKRLPFEEFMNEINKYKFVLAPRGAGVDTHRFWEALLMGSIPIVETSNLDSLYNQFPCIIVKSFREINEVLLNSYVHDSEKVKNIEKYLLIENFNKAIYGLN